jgi:hypothetical protein
MTLDKLVLNIKLIEPRITKLKLTIRAEVETNGIIQAPAQEYEIEQEVNIPLEKFKDLLEKVAE